MVRPNPTRVLVWMCVLIAVNQLGFGSVVPVLALYARSFGVTQSAIGLAIAVYGLARFLVAMPVGRLTDVVGRRAALALGGLVTAAGNVLCGVAPSFPVFVAARFVAGIGPLPGGVLAERFGLAAPFFVYAVAGTVAAVVAWFQIPETRATGLSAADAAAPPPFAAQVRLLTSHTGFVLVALVSFMNAVARTGALFNVIPVLARDRLALSTDRIGVGLALSSLVGLVLAYPAGVLVDRWGRKVVIVPATAVAGLSLILFLTAPSYAWFLVACGTWSVAVGISGAAPAAYAADVAPPGMNAAAMSTFRMLADLGYVVGPIVLGVVTDVFGADAALGGTAACLVLVALLFARLAPESDRPRL